MTVLRLKISPDRVLLSGAFLVFSISTIVWTVRDKTPPPWDPSDHLITAYDYFRPLAHGQFADFNREFFFGTHYYAPLVHLTTCFFFLIFGASRLSGIAVNLVSLAILMASTCWIGNKVYAADFTNPGRSADLTAGPRDPNKFAASSDPNRLTAGAFAAVLVASYHFPAWLLHDAFLDFPLIAIVALSFALLIKAGDFRGRREAIVFGISAGLGLLTKQTFAFFFIFPAIYLVGRALWSKDIRALMNLGLAGLVALAVAAIWYAPHLKHVIAIYHTNQQAAIDEGEAPLFSFMSNVVYLHGLVSFQIQVIFAIVFAVGLIVSIKRYGRQSVLLYLWMASGIGAFTMVANKDMRYTVPVLPAVALISAAWVGRAGVEIRPWRILRRAAVNSAAAGQAIPQRRHWLAPITLLFKSPALKSVACIAILAWAFVSFVNAQWPRPGMGTYINTPHFQWMVYARNYFGFDHRPLDDNWGVPGVVAAIESSNATGDGRLAMLTKHGVPTQGGKSVSPGIPIAAPPSNSGQPPTVGVIVNLPYLNPSGIALYSRLYSTGHSGPPILKVLWLVSDSAKDQIAECDYLVVRTGLEKADWVGPLEKEIQKMVIESPDRFTPIARFPIPMRDAEVVVYKCRR